MAEITRYVLVDRDNHEEDWEYDTLQEAIEDADKDHAVIERHYVYDDSELVWAPNGAYSWPPKRASRMR